ncbi:hypothetical protein ACTZGH_22435 [Enterobacter ludwigii]|uniref:hypothetical protein n=1 Tax=Enterobacter TaxID=547 RepID=UPI002941466D|nr:hypothetical protein [Citrobacter amalonaticus]
MAIQGNNPADEKTTTKHREGWVSVTGNRHLHGVGKIGYAEDRQERQYLVSLRPWLAEILTPGEYIVLGFLLNGKSLTAIASLRKRNVKTISTQKISLYRKLKIVNDLLLYKTLLERDAITLTQVPC